MPATISLSSGTLEVAKVILDATTSTITPPSNHNDFVLPKDDGDYATRRKLEMQDPKGKKMGKDKKELEEKLTGNEDQLLSASKEGKGKRLWKKVKYQLVEYHSLPGYLKDNEYILGHYRAEWPLKQALLSIFTIHNETLNVWTHLIGFFLFLALTIYTAIQVPKVVDLHSLQNLPDVLRKADLHKLQAELLTCLPSLPHMPDLHRLRDGLLRSPSNWHILDLLTNCLPERFSHSNHTDVCLLFDFILLILTGSVHSVINATKDGFAWPGIHKSIVGCVYSFERMVQPPFISFIPSVLRVWLKRRSVKEDVANIIAPLLVRPITRWPFYAFLGGAMFCLLASSACHLLSCHSERISYIMLRLDYAGIAALISTSFYPPVYYSFMCYPFFCNLYLGFITLLGIGTILGSLLPVFQTPEYRSIRASLFFGMGLSGAVPILHKLVLFWHQPEALHTTGYELLMGIFYGIGALVYAMRVPERWMPGKFDIAGHSHQLFHVLVVAGAYTHYQAGLVYLRWRDLQGC
ncbi:hypothetical protein RND71_011638 [Anisodus tanguticus]|uniref:Uncharacterized protein n=1 Tax=Anisodus tanguticus TaxID=243964 RepID=A0AAE1SDS1_9SOLA|nr:hypothetical protein RND71_011638 [Anisodus tanguticus]